VPKRQPHSTQLYQRGGFALDGLRPDSGVVDPRSLFEDVHRPTGDHHDGRDGRERLDQHPVSRAGRGYRTRIYAPSSSGRRSQRPGRCCSPATGGGHACSRHRLSVGSITPTVPISLTDWVTVPPAAARRPPRGADLGSSPVSPYVSTREHPGALPQHGGPEPRSVGDLAPRTPSRE